MQILPPFRPLQTSRPRRWRNAANSATIGALVGRGTKEKEAAAPDPTSGEVARAISIVVVSRGPSLALARLLRSLRRAERVEDAEVLLGFTDGSERLAQRLAERLLPGVSVQVVADIPRPPAAARNEVLALATAPLFVFLDDDVEVPTGFLTAAIDVMEDECVAAAGGPNLTAPDGSELEKIAGRVLASPVGTGPLRDRYRAGPTGPGTGRNLMLCNLIVRRSATAGPLFDGRLASAEENELLERLGRGGARIEYRPALAVYHRRRESLSSHLRQMLKYGYGRGQMIVRAFSPGQLVYTIPSLGLLAVLAAAVFVPLLPISTAAIYFAVILVASVRISGLRQAPLAAALLAATHLGYSVGLLAGVARELARAVALQGAAGRRSEGTRDAAGTLAALGCAVIAGSVAGIILARVLGPAGRGLFELGRTFALTTSGAAGLGLGSAAIYAHGRAAITRQGLFGACLATLGGGALLGVGLGAFLLADRWHGLGSREIVVVSASVPLIAFYTQAHNALRGVGEEAWFRRTMAARDAVFVILLGIVLALGGGLGFALVAWAAHWLLGAGAMAVVLARACGRPRWPGGASRTLLAFGSSQVIAALLMFLHMRVGLFVLRGFERAADVGQYAVAFGAAEILSFGGLAVGLVLFPRTVRSAAADPTGGRERAERAIRGTFAFTFVGAVLLVLGGPALVETIFGADFSQAGDPLRALCPGMVAVALIQVIRSDLTGRGRIWTVAAFDGMALVIASALALVLVPPFGTTGAAIAFSIAHTAMLVGLLGVFVHATRGSLRLGTAPAS
jgi:O-antigen/teichoic acid export membrane protein/GT2 family glycosyltransferase